MPSSSLPLWVRVLQALAVPVIASVGVWIASQQMYIARTKLRHDLYDRRYAVFQATRQFLDEASVRIIVSDDTFRSFALGTADAAFLFDDALAAYLTEMRGHAKKAQGISMAMENFPAGDKKAQASAAAGEQFIWLMQQIDGLADRFRPFLTLDRRSRSARRFPWW
ncbi:MAG TPA: hypothetical protein VNJ12_05685 [Candidatus Dormibacteraeota bacterium]|nr:hypothetical protein [Candidatus Dormibacteraeota bacterium]